jgi:hypothetical protein
VIDGAYNEDAEVHDGFPCPMCRQMTDFNAVGPADMNFINIMDLFEVKC